MEMSWVARDAIMLVERYGRKAHAQELAVAIWKPRVESMEGVHEGMRVDTGTRRQQWMIMRYAKPVAIHIASLYWETKDFLYSIY